VNRADWSRVAHAGMEIMNPLPAEKLDAVLDALGPARGGSAIDLGCGKGELLARLADRYASGVGVDLSPDLLAEARSRAPAVEFVEADATRFDTSRRFDLAASVGGPATLAQVAELVATGGHVLYGDGYWRRRPTHAYLEALGATEEDLADYAGLVRGAEALGLTPLYAASASEDDFDRYEWTWSLNGERYAAANPDEPGVEDFIAWIRNGRRRYVDLGGRETLGFGLFLFAR
jgi:SAM-dependent methyltransferase